MRVLITGGSGFLGTNLVRHLLTTGDYSIRSLDRAAFNCPESSQIETVLGDIRDRRCVRRSMRGIEAVVHCAAALPLYPYHEIVSTEIDGTRILLEEAAHEGIERFVFISSTAVYGIPDHAPVRETDPLSGVGPYGRAKVAAESLCGTWRNEGMCITIFRPKSFIGPERLGVFSLLYDWAIDGKGFPVLGRGTNHYQLLDVEDLCRAVALALTKQRERVDDVFNVGARDFGTLRDDFQAVLDEAGHGKRVVALPMAFAVPALRLLELLHLSPLYRWVYETAGKESFVAIDKIAAALGFEPRYSNRAALLRNYRWYRENQSRFAGRVGLSHRDLWSQGALRFAKLFF